MISGDLAVMLQGVGRAPVYAWAAAAIKPRARMLVSDHADKHRIVSTKQSPLAGRWRTDSNPILREPMDCLSKHSPVQDVTLKFPIQIGKTEVGVNWICYTMDHDPAPMMVCLPGEASQAKWLQQKLQPTIEVTECMQRALTSTSSRNAANRAEFKDFAGGQLMIEHAGSPARLKSATVAKLLVDELDEFAASLRDGSDPVAMLDGRTSAYPTTGKRLYTSTPQLRGVSRIDQKYEASDQREYHVPCPECGHRQPLVWSGLIWSLDANEAWYRCSECSVAISEHHKPEMIRKGRWVPRYPERAARGYHINCLYYAFGLGPRWATLARMWLDAQGDPSKLRVFINDRLAESWEDPAMRAVKQSALRDRAESYPMRQAPDGVLAITAGVDTQDDRLEVHIIGWGKGLVAWTLDYTVLPGDPASPDVWLALEDLLNKPIEHAKGALMHIEATAIDTGGHRGEAVKSWVRKAAVRRPMAIFGGRAGNAPVINRGTLVDVTYAGRAEKKGLRLYQVGVTGIKHLLYSRISVDADVDPEKRQMRTSDQLPIEYFAGIVSETYDALKNRFIKRSSVRNEPLDTWVYAYAATHHPHLRLHRHTASDWAERASRITAQVRAISDGAPVGTKHPHPAASPGPSAPTALPSAGRKTTKRRW